MSLEEGTNPSLPTNSPPPPSQQSNFSNQNTYGQPAPRQQHYQQNTAPAFQPQPSRRMRAIKSPNESFALTNRVASSPNEFPPHTRYVLVEHQYVFSIQYACTFSLLFQGIDYSQKGRHSQLTATPPYLMIYEIGQTTPCKSHAWDSATYSASGSTSDSTRRSMSLLGPLQRWTHGLPLQHRDRGTFCSFCSLLLGLWHPNNNDSVRF